MISIIIPVYNVEEYLPICLDSILEQTYNDFEVLLINDGSTDKSLDVSNNYAKVDDRIKVKSIENSGSSVARNVGIRMARGEYLLFVDSDDYLDSTLINELYQELKKNKVRVSVALGRKITPQKEIIQTADVITGDAKILQGKEKIQFIFEHVAPWAKLFHRDIFNDFEFKKGIVHQDLDLIPKIVYNEESIVVIYKQLYNYLVREDSITGKNIKRRKPDLFYIIDTSLGEFTKKKNPDAKYVIAEYVLHGYRRLKRIIVQGERVYQREYIKAYKNCYRKWLGVILINDNITLKDKLGIMCSIFSMKIFEYVGCNYLKHTI